MSRSLTSLTAFLEFLAAIITGAGEVSLGDPAALAVPEEEML